MHRIKQQDGITVISVLFIVLLVGSAVFLTIKLVPVYLEHLGVVSSLQSLEKEYGLHGKPKAELLKLLQKRLDINDVRRVSKEDVTIKQKRRETLMHIAYEVQIPLVSNIHLLVTYDDSVSLN